MADAKVVHINDGRPARGTQAVLAGADRATGERERRRRRTTPLLSGADADASVAPSRTAPHDHAAPGSSDSRDDAAPAKKTGVGSAPAKQAAAAPTPAEELLAEAALTALSQRGPSYSLAARILVSIIFILPF